MATKKVASPIKNSSKKQKHNNKPADKPSKIDNIKVSQGNIDKKDRAKEKKENKTVNKKPVADEKNKIYTKKTVFQKAKSPEIPEYNNALKTASADSFPKKEIKTTSKPANSINRKPAEKNTASGSNNVQKNSSIIIENDIILLKRKMHREIFQRRLERKLFTIIEEREEMVEEI